MASVGGVRTGVEAGNDLVDQARQYAATVADRAAQTDLEGVAHTLDTVAVRLAALGDSVGKWPVGAAHQRSREANRQFDHSLEGTEHTLAREGLGALTAMGSHLHEARSGQTELVNILRALGEAVTSIATRVREEAVPVREVTRQAVKKADAFGAEGVSKIERYQQSTL